MVTIGAVEEEVKRLPLTIVTIQDVASHLPHCDNIRGIKINTENGSSAPIVDVVNYLRMPVMCMFMKRFIADNGIKFVDFVVPHSLIHPL